MQGQLAAECDTGTIAAERDNKMQVEVERVMEGPLRRFRVVGPLPGRNSDTSAGFFLVPTEAAGNTDTRERGKEGEGGGKGANNSARTSSPRLA